MRLKKARVTKYRSIRDSGWFDVEKEKTILVGPNEAGKTALLQALQQVGPPDGVRRFDALRDYPRSEYNDITIGRVRPQDVTVVEAHFSLEDDDKAAIPEEFREATYARGRRLDNSAWHDLKGAPAPTTYADIKKDLLRLAAHVDANVPAAPEGQPPATLPSSELETITQGWQDAARIKGDPATKLEAWLKKVVPFIDEKNQDEENRRDRLSKAVQLDAKRDLALKTLDPRTPVFVPLAIISESVPIFISNTWPNDSRVVCSTTRPTTTEMNAFFGCWGSTPASYRISAGPLNRRGVTQRHSKHTVTSWTAGRIS